MEKIHTECGELVKATREETYTIDVEKTPEQRVYDYCKQFIDFKEEQIKRTKGDEFVFTRRLQTGKSGGVYLFDKNGKLRDVVALHDIKPISTKFGKISPPESKGNRLDA